MDSASGDPDVDGCTTDALAIDARSLGTGSSGAVDDDHVRDVHAPIGSPDDRSVDDLLDEVADHDTVVLGRSAEDGETDDDPRARIPAWEDIVFGVRRHR